MDSLAYRYEAIPKQLLAIDKANQKILIDRSPGKTGGNRKGEEQYKDTDIILIVKRVRKY